jgi:uncharacterized protein (TIGR02186 family)
MFRLFILTFLLTITSLSQSQSRPIISGISTNEIKIDSDFTGQKILLFGAKGGVGDVVIVVRGPKKNYIVNKKAKILGVWHNKSRVEFDDVYSYYSFFSTNPEARNSQLFKNLEMGKENIHFKTKPPKKSKKKNEQDKIGFSIQLVDKLSVNNLYLENPSEVDFLDETLFKVMLDFPKNISRGEYLVEIYLVDDDNLTAFQSIPIYVKQVGFSAKVNDMAHYQSFRYAMLSILLAVVAGFIANVVFNKLFK